MRNASLNGIGLRGVAAANHALEVLDRILSPADRGNQRTFRADETDDECHALRRDRADAIMALLPLAPAP